MATNGLDQILTGANDFISKAVSSGNELFDLSMRQAVVASEDAGLATTVGTNLQIIDSAKQNAELATQNARKKAANNLGTDLNAQGEVLSGLSADVLRLMKEKRDALAVVRQKQSVGLLDDPLSYIFNQISLPDDIAKHNAINEELGAAQSDIQKLNLLTQGTVATQNQLTESITQAGIKASADNIAASAKIAANKSTLAALGYNAQGIQSALTINHQILSTQFQTQQAIQSQEHLGIALANLELHRQEFDWRKEEQRYVREARDKNTDADKYLISKVNDGLVRMGMAPIPDTSSKAGNVLALIKSGAASGSIYHQALQISNDSEMAGGATILAPSPARAVELLSQVPGLKLPSVQEPVKDLLRNATQAVATAAAQPGSQIDLKNPAARNAAIDGAAKSILSSQADKIIPGDQTNVFNIGDIKALIVASPPLQKLPVVEKVLIPAAATGVDISDPNRVYGLIIQGIQNKTITYQEATEITSVYQRGVKVNLEAKQLQSFGLNLTPKSANDPSIFSYRTPINTSTISGIFTSKQIVDLTNPFAVSRAINKTLAEIAQLKFGRAAIETAPGVYGSVMDTQKPLLEQLFGTPGAKP